MKSINLRQLYRNSIGYDRLDRQLVSAMKAKPWCLCYLPYNMEVA